MSEDMMKMHPSILKLLRLISGKNRSGQLKQRVAQRRSSDASGLFKVLNRDKFYAKHYQGAKNPMDMIDVSTTGCAFATEFYIPAGAFIEIELKRLSQNYMFDSPLVASCETVYCIPIKEERVPAGQAGLADSAARNRVGAKFLEIDPKNVDRIRGFSEQG